MKTRLLLSLFAVFISLFASAQDKYTKDQKVEVEWKGKWYKATILEAKNNSYKIHYDGYTASSDEVVTASRIRSNKNDSQAAQKTTAKAGIRYGKYGCTASKYVNGSYEYQPKGSFVLSKNGVYAYNGFSKPSSGKFTVDVSGIISFKGGYFDGGKATPIEGQENRYYLVFPTIPDSRWTCGFTGE